jgi:hypothetical protein
MDPGQQAIGPTGLLQRTNVKLIEFYPQGDNYGRLVTDDPEVIKFLNKRVEEVGDVFGPQEYTRRTTPMEQRIRQMEDSLQRTIQDRDRLEQELKRLGQYKPAKNAG